MTTTRLRPKLSLQSALNRRRTLPINFEKGSEPPVSNVHYAPLQTLPQTGFKFTLRSLLHAIGTKLVPLPTNEKDEAISHAYFYTKVLDLKRSDLGFVPGIDSDLLTNRSNEVGIGLTCLIARRFWGFEWQHLEPIRAKGKRFDFRAEKTSVRAIFEAKLSTHTSTHRKQINDGLAKKTAHRRRKQRFDVELIVATLLQKLSIGSSMVLADPPLDIPADTFGPDAQTVYAMRHWARVLRYSGATESAFLMYRNSNPKHSWSGRRVRPVYPTQASTLETIELGGRRFVGRWRDSWYPRRREEASYRWGWQREHTFAEDRQKKMNERLQALDPRIRIFQGIDQRVFDIISSGENMSIFEEPVFEAGEIPDDDNDESRPMGHHASIFSDGSIMIILEDEQDEQCS